MVNLPTDFFLFGVEIYLRLGSEINRKKMIVVSLIATENYKFRNPVTNSVWYISPAIDGFQKKHRQPKILWFYPPCRRSGHFPRFFFEVSSNPKGKPEKNPFFKGVRV